MSYIQYNPFDKVIIEVKPNYVNEEIIFMIDIIQRIL
jgi:hypothetical protein